jgi:hypothetical protein
MYVHSLGQGDQQLSNFKALSAFKALSKRFQLSWRFYFIQGAFIFPS